MVDHPVASRIYLKLTASNNEEVTVAPNANASVDLTYIENDETGEFVVDSSLDKSFVAGIDISSVGLVLVMFLAPSYEYGGYIVVKNITQNDIQINKQDVAMRFYSSLKKTSD